MNGNEFDPVAEELAGVAFHASAYIGGLMAELVKAGAVAHEQMEGIMEEAERFTVALREKHPIVSREHAQSIGRAAIDRGIRYAYARALPPMPGSR